MRKHAASHKHGKHATGTWNSSYWRAKSYDTYYQDPGEDNGWTWEDEFWCSMNNHGANSFLLCNRKAARKKAEPNSVGDKQRGQEQGQVGTRPGTSKGQEGDK